MASSERWPPPRARRRLAVAPTAIRTCPLCEATCGLIALYGFAVRDVANCSPPVLDRPQGMPDEWQTLLRLTANVTGQRSAADVAAHVHPVDAERLGLVEGAPARVRSRAGGPSRSPRM